MTTVYLNDSVESCWDINKYYHIEDNCLFCDSPDLSESYVIPLTQIKYVETLEDE